MAFTFRPKEKHDQILDKLCKKLKIKTKQKALLWIIENIGQITEDRDKYFQQMNRMEKETAYLRNAIKGKIEADQKLFECISTSQSL